MRTIASDELIRAGTVKYCNNNKSLHLIVNGPTVASQSKRLTFQILKKAFQGIHLCRGAILFLICMLMKSL